MPTRYLKESICTSEDIAMLTEFEETMFYRLIVNVDDYGRFFATPQLVTNKCFPLLPNDKKRVEKVNRALEKMNSIGLITLYIGTDDKQYLYLTKWKEHQTCRAVKSKFPEPAYNCIQLQADANNGLQEITNASVIVIDNRNRESNNEIVNDNIIAETSSARVDDRFESFWQTYPKKVGKQAALKAWQKIKVNEELYQKMLSAIGQAKQSEQWRKDNGQYIPNPATWLNQGRWDDEYATGAGKPTNNWGDSLDFLEG